MAYQCDACYETQVTNAGDFCAPCLAKVESEEAAELDAVVANGRLPRGKPPSSRKQLEDQARLYSALQKRLFRQINSSTKRGTPEKGGEGVLVGRAMQLGRQIQSNTDAISKLNKAEETAAKKRTPAERFKVALGWLLSTRCTPAQRKEALEALKKGLGET